METYFGLLGFISLPCSFLFALNKVPSKIWSFFIVPVKLKDWGGEQVREKYYRKREFNKNVKTNYIPAEFSL